MVFFFHAWIDTLVIVDKKTRTLIMHEVILESV